MRYRPQQTSSLRTTLRRTIATPTESGGTSERRRSFRRHGYSLSPPFAQMVVGQTRECRLSISQESFPEIKIGDSVQIETLSSDLAVSRAITPLQRHSVQQSILVANWSMRALARTSATGVRATTGAVRAEAMVEILASEAERYAGVRALQFQKDTYRVRHNSRKKVRLLGPLRLLTTGGVVELQLESSEYKISGTRELMAKPGLGIAIAEFSVLSRNENPDPATLRAEVGGESAETKILGAVVDGSGIVIKLEDVDHGSQRYRWRKNVLEIAARHSSLARYIGPKAEGFPGQEERHFRVLIAEIVADAVCSQVLRQNIQNNPADFENADWDLYYTEFSELMASFLQTAHALIVPDPRG